MRKLKTWEIVLLVIFYPVGICVLIYRLVKKGKLKREAEEAQRTAAEEREAWEKHLSCIGEARAYGYLLDNVPHADFMHVVRDMKEASLTEQIEYLKSAYIKAAW